MSRIKNKKPELVSPAGDWASLTAAVESGADAVYFGVKGLNMRNTATNFDLLEIKKVMAFLRKHARRGYLALNVIIMNNEIARIRTILKKAKAVGVDAVILWDMAALSIAREIGLDVHISTQQSISNCEAIKFFERSGVTRVVLARECTLADMKRITAEIRRRRIRCGIEAFVHGAMCVSISGRCFLSQYSFGKSANRGECLQPCRREFTITDCDKESSYIIGDDYIMSPHDLCTIDFIDTLIQAQIHAFKIEGRVRSPEYVRVVTAAYRRAIDAFFEKKLDAELKRDLKEQVSSVYNRGFSSGFYFGRPDGEISRQLEHTRQKVFLGEVTRFFKRINVAEIRIRHGILRSGDEVMFIGKHTAAPVMRVNELQKEHRCVAMARTGEHVGVKLPFIVRPRDKVFLWKVRPVEQKGGR